MMKMKVVTFFFLGSGKHNDTIASLYLSNLTFKEGRTQVSHFGFMSLSYKHIFIRNIYIYFFAFLGLGAECKVVLCLNLKR
jgi:hypothetical protein